MFVSESVIDRVEETVRSVALTGRTDFHLEPRCRVCRNNHARLKVNDLLASGASYAMVVRTLGDENVRLDKGDRVTIDSVRNHCVRHFPVQNAAKATYRDILERRAQENQVDFAEGVATAITPMAFLETVMAKSYEVLVDSATEVDVNTGILAASRLQSIVDSRAGMDDLVAIKVQVNRLIGAVRTSVPEHMWDDIVQKLDATNGLRDASEAGDFYDRDDTTEGSVQPSDIEDFDDELDEPDAFAG